MTDLVTRSLALRALISQAESFGTNYLTLRREPVCISLDWVPRDSPYVQAMEDPNAYMIHIGPRDIGRVPFNVLIDPAPAWAQKNVSLFYDWHCALDRVTKNYKKMMAPSPEPEIKDPVRERSPETLEKKLTWLINDTPDNGILWSGFGAELIVKVDASGQRTIEAIHGRESRCVTITTGIRPDMLIVRPSGGSFWLDGGLGGWRMIATYWADMTQLLATVRLPAH